MNKSILVLILVTVLYIILLYLFPGVFLSAEDNAWGVLEAVLICLAGIGLLMYKHYMVRSDDAYSSVQYLYMVTFTKILIVAGIAVAYVVNNRTDYSKHTLLGLVGIYLIYHVLITLFALKKND